LLQMRNVSPAMRETAVSAMENALSQRRIR
jgi:hypothetical protein